MLCAVRERDAHGRRFVPRKFAYFVSFDISVTHACIHIVYLIEQYLEFAIIHCMRSCNPHNNNPAAMNSTLYARMPGIILCDACLPFCNHHYSTANTSTNVHAHAQLNL